MTGKQEKIVEFVIATKDHFRIEETKNECGTSIEDEKLRIERAKLPEVGNPYLSRIPKLEYGRSGNCDLCNEFSNIYCSNCKKWVCYQHLTEHGQKVHGMQINLNI